QVHNAGHLACPSATHERGDRCGDRPAAERRARHHSGPHFRGTIAGSPRSPAQLASGATTAAPGWAVFPRSVEPSRLQSTKRLAGWRGLAPNPRCRSPLPTPTGARARGGAGTPRPGRLGAMTAITNLLAE